MYVVREDGGRPRLPLVNSLQEEVIFNEFYPFLEDQANIPLRAEKESSNSTRLEKRRRTSPEKTDPPSIYHIL